MRIMFRTEHSYGETLAPGGKMFRTEHISRLPTNRRASILRALPTKPKCSARNIVFKAHCRTFGNPIQPRGLWRVFLSGPGARLGDEGFRAWDPAPNRPGTPHLIIVAGPRGPTTKRMFRAEHCVLKHTSISRRSFGEVFRTEHYGNDH